MRCQTSASSRASSCARARVSHLLVEHDPLEELCVHVVVGVRAVLADVEVARNLRIDALTIATLLGHAKPVIPGERTTEEDRQVSKVSKGAVNSFAVHTVVCFCAPCALAVRTSASPATWTRARPCRSFG